MFKKKRIDSINLIPFIDIMLVLLVIVLTTATFVSSGKIPINLPKAEGSISDVDNKELKEVEITISPNGEYYLDKQIISLEELRIKLSEMPEKTPILLRGDQKSYFEKFTSLIGMLNSINRINVEIEVEKK